LLDRKFGAKKGRVVGTKKLDVTKHRAAIAGLLQPCCRDTDLISPPSCPNMLVYFMLYATSVDVTASAAIAFIPAIYGIPRSHYEW